MELDEVKIFIEVIFQGKAESGTGKYSTLLEFVRKNGETATIEEQGCLTHTTKNRTFLSACIQGLKRLRRPCEIVLNLNCPYIARNLSERLQAWEKYGFTKQSKEPIKNAALWQEFAGLLKQHTFQTTQDKDTPYTSIMRFNLVRAKLEPHEDGRIDNGETPHNIPEPGRA